MQAFWTDSAPCADAANAGFYCENEGNGDLQKANPWKTVGMPVEEGKCILWRAFSGNKQFPKFHKRVCTDVCAPAVCELKY